MVTVIAYQSYGGECKPLLGVHRRCSVKPAWLHCGRCGLSLASSCHLS